MIKVTMDVSKIFQKGEKNLYFKNRDFKYFFKKDYKPHKDRHPICFIQ